MKIKSKIPTDPKILDAMSAEFDAEFSDDRFHPMTAAERKEFLRVVNQRPAKRRTKKKASNTSRRKTG